MRAARNRASALDSLVDSPGSVGWKPRSVTYSSSASAGYSQLTSSSLICFGRPSETAVKLWLSQYKLLGGLLLESHLSTVYSVQNTFFLVSHVRVPSANRFCD